MRKWFCRIDNYEEKLILARDTTYLPWKLFNNKFGCNKRDVSGEMWFVEAKWGLRT